MNDQRSDKDIVSRIAKVHGVQLHYLNAGRGPAVILLHGFAKTSHMWRPLIPIDNWMKDGSIRFIPIGEEFACFAD
jgi:hypothetical protein